MIHIDPLHHLTKKLSQLEVVFVVGGVVFILLGIGILFFPAIVQYLFVVGFIIMGVSFWMVAAKLESLRSMAKRFEIHVTKRK
jgi:uncharacterized membrane protein HdeD (DUF308 family)